MRNYLFNLIDPLNFVRKRKLQFAITAFATKIVFTRNKPSRLFSSIMSFFV